MKKIFALLLLLVISSMGFSQNNGELMAIGLPGDNLNLYAVLDIFQKSPTLEDFERALNDKSNNINNLDLNNDRNIDYLRIVSHQVSNVHTIVIQDPINANENQDVAVIQDSKEPSGQVYIQIIGDEALYGKNYIIEPSDLAGGGTPNPGYQSGGVYVNEHHREYRPVRDWLIVNFLFTPTYVVYRSPYVWGYYPVYWHPWAPIYFENYWGYHRHYYGDVYYQRNIEIRNTVYYNTYVSRRNYSTTVVENNKREVYNTTYNGHHYQNFGNQDYHANGTPRNANVIHNTNGNPRNPTTNNGNPRTNNNPTDGNTPRPVRNNRELENPRVDNNERHPDNNVPRGNPTNTNTPRPANNTSTEPSISNPRAMNPRGNQGNKNENVPGQQPNNSPRPKNNSLDMPRNNAPSPRQMKNSEPRNEAPKNNKPPKENRGESKENGRR